MVLHKSLFHTVGVAIIWLRQDHSSNHLCHWTKLTLLSIEGTPFSVIMARIISGGIIFSDVLKTNVLYGNLLSYILTNSRHKGTLILPSYVK